MNALGRHLAGLIRAQGPLTVGQYMAEALNNPRHGYYARSDPIGRDGDFITAPEISQAFGELIGLWCVATWEAMGRPRPLRCVELGPGRGTLMADALRAAAVRPGFGAAITVHLVELSGPLRETQRRALAETEVVWHHRLDEVPDGPLLVIANEFFDALPIRQFHRTTAGWCERCVALTSDGSALRFVLSPAPLADGMDGLADAPPGSVAELCPAGRALAQELGARAAEFGGAALILDYGVTHSGAGETLQAVRGHHRHDVLEVPGEADLSARVDFAALAEAARVAGAAAYGPVEQGRFLAALGIAERIAMLTRDRTAEEVAALRAGAERLTAAAQMGSLFKVLAIAHPDLPTPAGFEPAP